MYDAERTAGCFQVLGTSSENDPMSVCSDIENLFCIFRVPKWFVDSFLV